MDYFGAMTRNLLAAETDGHELIEFVDLMMYGFWGEGHTSDWISPFPTRAIAERVNVPIIASGGAGKLEHFAEVLTDGQADAALAASLFHDKQLGVGEIKQYLAERGLPIRPVWAGRIGNPAYRQDIIRTPVNPSAPDSPAAVPAGRRDRPARSAACPSNPWPG